MVSFIRLSIYSTLIMIGLLQYSCAVSGKIKFDVPGGDTKIESKEKRDHHEKDDDKNERDKKKKDHDKKEHEGDD